MPSPSRLRAARTLLVIAALSAAFAGISALGALPGTHPDLLMSDTWRAVGLATFAVLFALLAWRPYAVAGLWELAIANKAALTVLALGYGERASGATEIAIADGLLTAALVAAYVLAAGWRTWQRPAVAAAR